jgi:Cu(I)/Ag(I) efflux system membrane fusion protein
MSEEKTAPPETPAEKIEDAKPSRASVAALTPRRKDDLRWWIKLVLQPVLLLAAGGVLIVALGAAQKLGWISAGGAAGPQHVSAGSENVRYICPMMCTPPQTEPGRCPVCAMELVPANSGGESDESSIRIDPAARRVANIRTAPVKAVPLTRKIRAIGKLSYDEGTLKTIAAYVDGRLERLYADYTGVVVEQGDHLALLYSPQLYSSQVELLVAGRARERNRPAAPAGAANSAGLDLYGSARERLIEFGMTASQIDALEAAGEANSRMHVCAPISGTVIEKLAVQGQYLKTGQPIYRLADLSTVWLMLELFPEDAASIRYGQKVEAEVQSMPGRKFAGRVAFIDPTVDSGTRTVGVRVVMPNGDGQLKVGDYARAAIAVNVGGAGERLAQVYDPELAGKWISPRHPHVVESSPGNCRVCEVSLVPAAQFGFTSRPADASKALVVPRDAVLMVGESSVVYVEVEPGRFELRSVVPGPSSGAEIAILEGVKEGEQVACSGNFLIDSQMQLAGNPSLIDPAKAKAKNLSEANTLALDIPPIGTMQMWEPQGELAETPAPGADADQAQALAGALANLSPADRTLAERQKVCPVTDMPLGSMGTPIKVSLSGRPVFICCEGCREQLLAAPVKYLAKLPREDVR